MDMNAMDIFFVWASGLLIGLGFGLSIMLTRSSRISLSRLRMDLKQIQLAARYWEDTHQSRRELIESITGRIRRSIGE